MRMGPQGEANRNDISKAGTIAREGRVDVSVRERSAFHGNVKSNAPCEVSVPSFRSRIVGCIKCDMVARRGRTARAVLGETRHSPRAERGAREA